MDVETFRGLLSPDGRGLLARVEAEGGEAIAKGADVLPLATRLRRDHSPSLVAAALTQARLRARGRAKFGQDAERMFFTADGLEQATRTGVAALRAQRYRTHVAQTEPTCVDLGCGVGGDLIALARAGCRVEGFDRDPLTVEVARANIEALGLGDRAAVRLADVTAVDERDVASYDTAFCDPARRSSRARVFDPRAYSPPMERAVDLVRRPAGGAVKVAPGIPHNLVPADAEAEWVSVNGEVKEAALWFGDLAGAARRRATLLPYGATLAADPSRDPPPVTGPARYVYEPDGAVVRAGLVAEVAAAVEGGLLDRTIAYVTAERYAPTPFARAYEITDILPFSLKRLRSLLRERAIGTVAIKKRGSAVDVQRLRRDLKLSGTGAATLVLTRIEGAHHVLICRPVSN